MELGLYDVATNNFSDAIYSNSEFYEAYYSRGNCFETLGNIAQAESDYNRAIEINPEYTYAIEALEILREKNKKYNK
jgi:tetratricopeptide (TPR) repeat protein